MIERLRKNSKKGLLEFIVIIPLIVAVLIFVGTAIGYEVLIAYFGLIDDMYGLYTPEEATIDYSLLPTVLEYNTTYIGDDFFNYYGFEKPEDAIIYYNDKRFDDIENYRGGNEKDSSGYVDGLAGYSFVANNKAQALIRGEKEYLELSVKTDMRIYEYSDLKFKDKNEYNGNYYFVQKDNLTVRDYVIKTSRCIIFVTISRKYFDDIPASSVEENDAYFDSAVRKLIDSFYVVAE